MLFPQLTPQLNSFYAIISQNNLYKGNIMHDIIGKNYGKWIVIGLNGRNKKGEQLFSCQCQCGLIKDQRFATLNNGETTQCKNCFFKSRINDTDLTNQKFGLWTAYERYKDINRNEWFYKCICECGTKKNIPGYRLKRGISKKCPHCRAKTHGMSKTKTFKVWNDILQRCLNPNKKSYKYYGDRGIKICDRWLKFENFFADMGLSPLGLQIDRTDNNGNYERGNCRWVTAKENVANRRISKKKVI